MSEFLREQVIYTKKREAFGDAVALYHNRFENDTGSVPQLEKARRYVEHWTEMIQQNIGLLFWGKPSTGKTFAAACIANTLLESEDLHAPSVKMTTFGAILTKLLSMPIEEKALYVNSFQTYGLLILDDFGMERQTDYAREQVFNIIDGRYLACKPLIVTTNLSISDLKNPNDIVKQRIFDRVLEMCVPVCFDGESIRQKKAKGKLQMFKQLTAK